MPDYGQIRERITKIQDQGLGLTVWEQNFIKSIIGQFKVRGWISKDQIDSLNKIYETRCPKD